MAEKPKIVVILGPTASGKSDLAVSIAKKFNGEIISADSRQIYKGLNIGSGKVPKDSISRKFNFSKMNLQYMEVELPYIYKDIIHHLLDVISPKKTFSVTQYQKLAKKALQKILEKGRLPIICGGTGFYIDALIYDYQLPKVPPQKELRKKLEKKSAEELFNELQKLDPERAENIDKRNKRRLVRALEIIIATGSPVPILRQTQDKKSSYDFLKIGIKKSPVELKRLINVRVEKWLKQGIIREVKNLHNPPTGGGLSWQRLNELGLEYRTVAHYLQNLIGYEEMVENLKKETWQYVKRQMTWFKRDKKIHWLKTKKEALRLVKNFLL